MSKKKKIKTIETLLPNMRGGSTLTFKEKGINKLEVSNAYVKAHKLKVGSEMEL